MLHCDAAAFVADVYNTSVQQGPTLPIATRSVLMAEYRSNSTKWRNRLLAALTKVQACPGHLLPMHYFPWSKCSEIEASKAVQMLQQLGVRPACGLASLASQGAAFSGQDFALHCMSAAHDRVA